MAILDFLMDRIAKKIASYGYCSRRDAERLIFEKRVRINGQIVGNPAVKISDDDIIEIDGKVINSEIIPRIFLYHKPVGVITTARDPQGRTTVFARIAKDYPHITERLVYVGRLDINSSGLLLLTNVPAIANYMERADLTRVYKVRVSGKLTDEQIKQAKAGIEVEGIRYSGIAIKNVSNADSMRGDGRQVRTVGGHEKNCWIEMSLTEGKNREIRKIINYFGLSVSRLIRIKYHEFSLGNIAIGNLIEADGRVVKKILQAIERKFAR